MLAQKNRARIRHAFQAFFGHGEDANLIDRAKAVFDGAHQPKAAVRVALEVQHGVDHVLEHARAGQGTLFGDVADQHDADAAGLGGACQVRRAFAHLRHRTRGRGELVGIHRLNRVNHRNRGLGGFEGGQNFLQLDFSQHLDLRALQPQAPRTQRDLRATFFAGDVERAEPGALQ